MTGPGVTAPFHAVGPDPRIEIVHDRTEDGCQIFVYVDHRPARRFEVVDTADPDLTDASPAAANMVRHLRAVPDPPTDTPDDDDDDAKGRIGG